MQKYIQSDSLRSFLNRRLRRTQRQTGTRLDNNVVVVISTFKNKQIVEVYAETQSRFLNRI